MTLRTLSAVLSAAILFCAPARLGAQPPSGAASVEAQEGWVRLFDGQSLYGWTAEGGSKWRAEGGVLRADSGPSGWLRSAAQFSDFVFHAEFRTHSATARSGVYFRAARQGNPGQTGFEVAIQDDGGPYLTGSIARFHSAPRLLSASGSWKSMDLTVRGAEIIVAINGNKTATLKSVHAKLGYFGLMYKEGSPVEFRNIRVKPLDFSCISNGRDLDGFRVVKPIADTPTVTEWSVRDGAIHGRSGPGELETLQAWDDFILQVDVRAMRPASGTEPQGALFFRGLRNGWRTGYSVVLRNEVNAQEGGLATATGAIAGLAPAKRLVGTSGNWQTITVLAVGRDIVTWVNGEIVAAHRDERTPGPNNPVNTARLLRGTTGLFIENALSSYDLRNYCVKRMNR